MLIKIISLSLFFSEILGRGWRQQHYFLPRLLDSCLSPSREGAASGEALLPSYFSVLALFLTCLHLIIQASAGSIGFPLLFMSFTKSLPLRVLPLLTSISSASLFLAVPHSLSHKCLLSTCCVFLCLHHTLSPPWKVTSVSEVGA